MTSTDVAAHLLGLHPSVRAELTRIAVTADALTTDEIVDALAAFVGVAEAFVAHRNTPHTIAMLDAVGRLLQATHNARQETADGN